MNRIVSKAFTIVAVACVALSANAFARSGNNQALRNAMATAPSVDVPVQNASFESPVLLPRQWTEDNVLDGWVALPGSISGVWRPDQDYFPHAVIDGKNILQINAGGISQTLPVDLQAMAAYSFTVQWGHREDWVKPADMALQFVAGDQVLATCAPQSQPPKGFFTTVTLTYYSNGSSPAVGQPLAVRILYLPTTKKPSNSQVDIDDVYVTFTDLSSLSSSAITSTQDCSVTNSN